MTAKEFIKENYTPTNYGEDYMCNHSGQLVGAEDIAEHYHQAKLKLLGIANNEALHIGDVGQSLPNEDEIEDAANQNADRIFGDDIGSNAEWYAMQHGFNDGVEWIKKYLSK